MADVERTLRGREALRRDAGRAMTRRLKLDARSSSASPRALAVGFVSRDPAAPGLQNALIALEPLGTIFIRLITMVVVPLVIASVFVGVASLGDVRALGRIGGKTLLYFLGDDARRGDDRSDRRALALRVGAGLSPAIAMRSPAGSPARRQPPAQTATPLDRCRRSST